LRRRAFAVLTTICACIVLSACADFTLVDVTATPNVAALPSLPPIGFNHRYGDSPVASADGFQLERQLFAEHEFWEVAIRADPVASGYVSLGNKTAVKAARHAATDVLLVIATEDRSTIEGLLAYRSDPGQQQYCAALLDHIRADGYDAIRSAQVLVFFTESDQHAKLSWSKKSGYTFAVYDNNLRGTALVPGATITPLPAPN